MRITDLINETKLSELGTAPMGMMKQAALSIGSKLPGVLGGQSFSANLDVGKRANELESTFKQWALRSGIDLTNVTANNIKSFLQQHQLPVPQTGLGANSFNLSDQAEAKQLWTSVAQQAYKTGGATAKSAPLGQRYGTSGATTPAPAGSTVSQLAPVVSKLTPQEKQQLIQLLRTTP